MTSAEKVAIRKTEAAGYPREAPYAPSVPYPEYPFQDIAGEPNGVYAAFRALLADLRLDLAHFDSPEWNPLGAYIQPGMKVLIKPNMVLDRHPRGGDVECLITHASVLRALLDYVFIALRGEGSVTIGDSPLQGTSFEGVLAASGLDRLVERYPGRERLPLSVVDFRQVHARIDARSHVVGWEEVPGDPSGYVEFELGEESALAPLAGDSDRFRVSNYRPEDTQQYHNPLSHRYVIARSVVDADVIFTVPKMKTHCKVGVTLSMKNFVGTVGRKQCLAHHREGGAAVGGDEYPGQSRLKDFSVALESRIDGEYRRGVRSFLQFVYRCNERLIKTLGLDPIRDGGWYGNDTAWRMVMDLVHLAQYGRADGTLAERPVRPLLCLVDGIIGGENEGPLEATPVAAGALALGTDPVLTDAAVATYMGLDYRKVPHIAAYWNRAAVTGGDPPGTMPAPPKWLLDGEPCRGDDRFRDGRGLLFKAPMGWRGHLELT